MEKYPLYGNDIWPIDCVIIAKCDTQRRENCIENRNCAFIRPSNT